MKKLTNRSSQTLLLCLAVCVGTTAAQAASFKHVANGVWSTGFSAGNTLLSQTGSNIDPHYTLIKLPAGCSGLSCTEDDLSLFGPSTYVVQNPGGQFPFAGQWLANNSGSQWIGPRSNQTNPDVNGTTFPNVGTYSSNSDFYVYRTIFNLGLLGLDPTTANISLGWLSDNANNDDLNPTLTSQIRLCAITSAGDPLCPGGVVPSSGNSGQSAGALTVVNLVHNGTTVNFGSGWMALDFIVYNSNIGFGLNPTGMRVEILSADAQAAQNPIPEPATLGMISFALIGAGLWHRRRGEKN